MAKPASNIVYRGQTLTGTVNLRISDASSGVEFPYAIPTGSTIVINFPGIIVPTPPATSTSVELSTANSGEVSIVDATQSKIAFNMSPTKSLLLALNSNADVDVIVTAPSGKVDIFELVNIYNIVDYANQ
jgi:hypothetical protein